MGISELLLFYRTLSMHQ